MRSFFSTLDTLRLIPMFVHLFERDIGPGSSLFGDSFFDVSETAAEFAISGLERAFRLHAVPAGQVGDDENYVANLAGDSFIVYLPTGDLVAQLTNLFFEF